MTFVCLFGLLSTDVAKKEEISGKGGAPSAYLALALAETLFRSTVRQSECAPVTSLLAAFVPFWQGLIFPGGRVSLLRHVCLCAMCRAAGVSSVPERCSVSWFHLRSPFCLCSKSAALPLVASAIYLKFLIVLYLSVARRFEGACATHCFLDVNCVKRLLAGKLRN